MIVFDLDYENVEYGYRMDGPFDPAARPPLRPHARSCSTRTPGDRRPRRLGRGAGLERPLPAPRPARLRRLRLGRRPPAGDPDRRSGHLRDARARLHPASLVGRQASRAPSPAIREKIPYLKELGVNCVELMPIFEFDEFENSRSDPETASCCMNYWGYSTVGFFAPKAGYAATGKLGMQVDELKALVKELHHNGIEVILDVVFNHTAEGNEHGPYISFRGIDNKTYYMLTPGGLLLQLQRLRQHAQLQQPGRAQHGARLPALLGGRVPHRRLPLRPGGDPRPRSVGRAAGQPAAARRSLAFDPDPGQVQADRRGLGRRRAVPGRLVPGLRALGRVERQVPRLRAPVPQGRRRAGRRDGPAPAGLARPVRRRAAPTASINFITCHDGFTLDDLVSYNDKHNEANGENNRDGAQRQRQLELRLGGPDRRPRHQCACAAGRSRTPWPCCWSARACR